MKVCAHILYGPFNNGHERFGSVEAAVEFFTREVAGVDFGTGLGSAEYGDEQVMDLYPQCDSCTSNECYHDYPMARYGVDSHGDVIKKAI